MTNLSLKFRGTTILPDRHNDKLGYLVLFSDFRSPIPSASGREALAPQPTPELGPFRFGKWEIRRLLALLLPGSQYAGATLPPSRL